MELIASSTPLKIRTGSIHFPRKMKKKLKKMGKYPQLFYVWEIENKTTSGINNIIF